MKTGVWFIGVTVLNPSRLPIPPLRQRDAERTELICGCHQVVFSIYIRILA